VAIRTIIWSDDAFLELQNTIAFLEENWTDREIMKLDKELAHTLLLISNNPYLFKASKRTDFRKAIVLKLNTLYYKFDDNTVEIVSFFSNRQNPDKAQVK